MRIPNILFATGFIAGVIFSLFPRRAAQAQIAANPPLVNFGEASINKVADVILPLSNIGAATLTVTDITHANPSFVIAAGTPFTLAPSETKSILISFIPALLGSQADTLKIFSTGAAPSPLRVPLSGVGTTARLPELSVQPLELKFDSALVGLPKPAKLRLHNRGAGDLTITRIVTNHNSFIVASGASNLVLGAGEKTEVNIDFKPERLESQTGVLTIESNDANENPLVLSMSGIGKAIPKPTLTGIVPAIGARLQALEVRCQGTNFISGVSTIKLGANITVNNVTVHRSDSVTARITIAENAATGARGFAVANNGLFGGGISANQSFTVINPAPVLNNATPNLVFRGETRDLILSGEGFIAGVTAVNVDAGIKLNSLKLINSSTLSANVTIAASAATGLHTISATNAGPGGGTSRQLSFTVNNPAPSLARIAPSRGNRLQTLEVGFKGENFIAGASQVNVGPNLIVNSVKVHRRDSLTANITITAEAELGPRTFAVINNGDGGGTSGTQAFTINYPIPAFGKINPSIGNRLQTLNAGFKGANFFRDITGIHFGAGIKVNRVTVHRHDSLTANITIGADADAAPRSVEISNPAPGGGTFSDVAFRVNNPKPTLTAVSPATAGRRQTLNLALTGSNFINGVTTVNAGNGIVINSIKVNDAASMTVNVTILAAASIGPRQLSVANPAPGGGTSNEQPFAIVNDAPAKPPLLSPANNAVITLSRQPQPIRFVWGRSVDGDAGDILKYRLNIKGPNLDTTLAAVKDTSVTLNLMPRLQVDSEYSWGVQVSDGVVNVTWPDRFVFRTSKIITAVEERRNSVPGEYRLEQNYPNPFAPATNFAATTIKYQLPQASAVTLTIYDLLGQEVAMLVNAVQAPGYYDVAWNGKNHAGKFAPGGVYIYRLRAGSFERVMKMTMAR
jgi:hypothetical protein